MSKLILALVFGTQTSPVLLPESEQQWDIFVKACIEEEILDERELRYVNYDGRDTYVKMLKNRHDSLKDAPLDYSVDIFVINGFTREWCNEQLMMVRNIQRDLRAKQIVNTDRGLQYERAIQQLELYYEICDYLRDATCEFYYVTVRRNSLLRLREILGEQNFYNGQIPALIGNIL